MFINMKNSNIKQTDKFDYNLPNTAIKQEGMECQLSFKQEVILR